MQKVADEVEFCEICGREIGHPTIPGLANPIKVGKKIYCLRCAEKVSNITYTSVGVWLPNNGKSNTDLKRKPDLNVGHGPPNKTFEEWGEYCINELSINISPELERLAHVNYKKHSLFLKGIREIDKAVLGEKNGKPT